MNTTNATTDHWGFELRELERERRVIRRAMRALGDSILELSAVDRSDLAHLVGAAHRALGSATLKIDRRLAEVHAMKRAAKAVRR